MNWIPVDLVLPEIIPGIDHTEEVLVSIGIANSVTVGTYHNSGFRNGTWWRGNIRLYNVIGWMKKPDPMKEQS